MGRSYKKPVPRYKVLRQWMIVVPLLAVLTVVLFFLWDGEAVDKRDALVSEAVDAGYVHILNGRFDRIGTRVLKDGEEYDEFEPSHGLLVRKNADANVLIKKGARFKDGADGERQRVEIYGREVQWVNDSLLIVEPYAIVLHRGGASVGDFFFLFVIIIPAFAIVELVLVVKFFAAYEAWKEQERNQQRLFLE